MLVQIKTTSDLDEGKWNKLLEMSAQSTVYHTKPWAESWQKSYHKSSSFFIVTLDEKGDYSAGLPLWKRERLSLRSFYSMPFGTYGGLVKKKDKDEDALLPLYEKLQQMLKGANVLAVEIVDFFSSDRNLPKIGFTCRKYHTHIIHLDNIDENNYMKFFTRKRGEGIRQSRRRGVKVADIRSLDDVKKCYQLLLETWGRHQAGSPKHSLKLFENIFFLMGKDDLLKWLIALKDEKIIGSLINLVFKDTLYAWQMGADFKELNARPNDALFLHSILWAKQNGLKFFNFGATPEGAVGMTKFKESWGARRKEYLIYEKKKGLGQLVEKIKKI